MSRRWIVFSILLLCCCVASVRAQQTGKSLIQRLPFLQGEQKQQQHTQSYRNQQAHRAHGSRPQQQVIVQTAATSPRAPRDRSYRNRNTAPKQPATGNSSSGRSLMDRLNLGGIFNRGGDIEQVVPELEADYPLPYEVSDLTGQPPGQSRPSSTTARSSRYMPPQSARQSSPSTRQQRVASAQPTGRPPQQIIRREIVPTPASPVQRPSAPRSVGASPQPQSQTIINPAAQRRAPASVATSRSATARGSASNSTTQNAAKTPAVASDRTEQRQATVARDVTKRQAPTTTTARETPTLDLRRGELQEALAALREPAEPRSNQPSVRPPSAADEAELPSYLVASKAADEPTGQKKEKEEAPSTPVVERITKVDSLDLNRQRNSDVATTDSFDSTIPESIGNALRVRTPGNVAEETRGPRETAGSTSSLAGENRTNDSTVATQPARDDSPPRASVETPSSSGNWQSPQPAANFGAQLDQWAGSSSSPAVDRIADNELRSRTAATSTARPGDVEPDGAFVADPELSGAQSGATTVDGFAQAAAGQDDGDVLLRYRQPMIASRVEGPRQLVVGRPAAYRVVLANSGDSPARELEAQVAIPAWAEIVDAASVQGRVEIVESSEHQQRQVVRWRLYDLAASESQTLDLKLIPRDGRALKLGVRWTHAPVGGEMLVEVQEPKLQVELNGPSEVLFGKPQRYQLTLSNPGDGLAEAVELQLTPPGAELAESIRHTVGPLKPGEIKTIELELTARDAGDLTIRAAAVAAGGLEAESIKNVLCRQPRLEIDWRGPDQKYAGSTATYFFRIRNPGTAATETVDVSVQLPQGIELLSASEGYTLNEQNSVVTWNSPSLQPNQERFMQLKCRLADPGAAKLALAAISRDEQLRDEKLIETEVVALADLKMEVSDPKGPIAVGDNAVYEVVIHNRGTTAATGVSVFALFSAGVDPTTVEGRENDIRDGRVTFRPIDHLPAGEQVRLRIHAAATQPGSHVFRAVVTCPELDVQLSAEEVTRFFDDDQRWETASKAYADEETDTVRR